MAAGVSATTAGARSSSTSGGRCREVGLAIARRLVDEAVWHEDRCTWTGDDIDQGPGLPPEGQLVHRPVGPDLYGGTSGIAWFLAHAWRATGDDGLRSAALGAVRHSLTRTGDSPAGTGLYTGAPGVAVVAGVVTRLLGDDQPAIRAQADALAATAAASCLAGDPPVADQPGGADLIQGDAGRVVGFLVLSRRPGAGGSLGAAALAAGERLLAAADRDGAGWSWPAPEPDWPALCGLGHGGSGPAVALDMLAARTGDARFAEGARQSERYERSWFNRDRGNWPDLRGAPADYPSFWCHGAGGIGLARLEAWRRTGDPTLLAEAAAAVDTATASTLRALGRSGSPDAGARFESNLSLCHGVGSVAELHALAAEVTGDVAHLGLGRRLALWAAGLAGDDEVPVAEAAGEIACGIPGGGEAPGLLVGLAGVGACFLRLADPTALPSPGLPTDW